MCHKDMNFIQYDKNMYVFFLQKSNLLENFASEKH